MKASSLILDDGSDRRGTMSSCSYALVLFVTSRGQPAQLYALAYATRVHDPEQTGESMLWPWGHDACSKLRRQRYVQKLTGKVLIDLLVVAGRAGDEHSAELMTYFSSEICATERLSYCRVWRGTRADSASVSRRDGSAAGCLARPSCARGFLSKAANCRSLLPKCTVSHAIELSSQQS